MNVIFAAGGTGGHIIPALAVADALRRLRPDISVHFVGAGTPLEAKLISPHYTLHTIKFVPVLGKGVGGFLGMLCRFPSALLEARRLFNALKPQVVFSFGGFPAFVPAVAATLLGIPRLLHEQNAKVGLANKCLGLMVQKIFAVPQAKGFLGKTPDGYVSNPVRQEFYDITGWELPSSGKPFIVLVLGGSQGAQSLNTAVVNVAAKLARDSRYAHVQFVHVAGEKNADTVAASYRDRGVANAAVLGFTATPWEVLAQAHLIISRAGAMSAAEFCAAARPVVYVPLALAAAHQSQNIAYQVDAGAALALAQDESLEVTLQQTLEMLIDSPMELSRLVENMRLLRGVGGETPATFLAEQALTLAGVNSK